MVRTPEAPSTVTSSSGVSFVGFYAFAFTR
jgi:hypothetical protein